MLKNMQRLLNVNYVKHFKLYKSGKRWLVGGVTTLLAGAIVYQPLVGHAAGTDMTAVNVTTAATTDSATKSSSTTTGASVASQADTERATSTSSTQVDVTQSKATSAVASTANSQTSSSATSTADSSTNSLTNQTSSATSQTSAVSHAQSSEAVSQSKSSTTTNKVTSSTDVANSSSVSSASSMASTADNTAKVVTTVKRTSRTIHSLAVTPTATAPTLTDTPHLSNFYVEPGGAYVLYNAKATLSLYPYNSPTPNQLYGFYVILPKSITGNLTDFQAGADALLKSMQSAGNIANFTSLGVYQLNNTTDGRQAFYFRQTTVLKWQRNQQLGQR